MARSILAERARRTVFTWLAVLVASLGVEVGSAEAAAVGQMACPMLLAGVDKVLQQHYEELRQSVEEGALFKAMVRRLGSAQTCSVRAEGTAILISYGFEQGASLEVKRDPSIEFSEQHISVNDLAQGEAIDLLRNAEQDFFSSDGCGISWRKPPVKEAASTSGAYDLIYRGNTCNCQGRMIYKKGELVALVFRSAC